MDSRLAAFDFDHTIVDDNSDVVVRRLLPQDAVSSRVQSLHKSDGWIKYMQAIFNLLPLHNVSEEQVRDAVRAIPEVPNMIKLLNRLHEQSWEVIIISDANSYFIGQWLEQNNLKRRVNKVFTNPAHFINGRLKIDKYHVQDWCNLSTKNLCKGYILESYIGERRKEGVKFKTVVYVGDGRNDYCPSLKLRKRDIVFPRIGYPLHEMLKSPSENKVVAQISPWMDAIEIYKTLNL